MDQQQRNLFIAIALSVAIFVGFQYFFPAKPKPVVPPADQTAQVPGTPAGGSNAPGLPGTPGLPGVTAASGAATREAALGKSQRIQIRTPRLNGSINLTGAKVDDLTLVNYRETTDPNSPEIVLLAPDGTADPYYLQFGWVAGDTKIKVPAPDTQWTAPSGAALAPDHPVDLTWDNGDGLVFTRHYEVDPDYMFTVTETAENHSAEPVTLYPYGLVSRSGEVPVSSTYLLHEGPVGVLDGTLHEVKYTALKGSAPLEVQSTGGWLGFTDKYWLTAMIPDQKEAVKTRFSETTHGTTDVYQVDYRGAEHVAASGGKTTTTARFFAGAKEVALLDRYEKADGVPLFDHAIDFGWFYWITKPIFLTLDFFYHLIGNFGLAIMALTVLIKLIFFPLANKSYRAMSKMKLLQPEMAKLRERFGEDKQRLNQEMMALYKRVGANPMAGCLPIVIQIPVFFSLYKVLYVTIEMRHQPFFGWIHDLSSPDPTSFINLFGLLPFAPPPISFLHIGAWPLIMGCTMFLQQKLNPQPPDPVQAKMFMILPVVFTFMLSQFAAGLVIYWSWNNLLSVAQQWVIMRRAAAAK